MYMYMCIFICNMYIGIQMNVTYPFYLSVHGKSMVTYVYVYVYVNVYVYMCKFMCNMYMYMCIFICNMYICIPINVTYLYI